MSVHFLTPFKISCCGMKNINHIDPSAAKDAAGEKRLKASSSLSPYLRSWVEPTEMNDAVTANFYL
jgi:hypothetical protein